MAIYSSLRLARKLTVPRLEWSFFLSMRICYYIVLLLVVAGCRSERHAEPVPRPVKTAVVSVVDSVRRDFAALTTADDASNLAFKISGRIIDIPVSKGQLVKKGELLAELDATDVRLAVEAARAAYDEAKSRMERAERLYTHDAISAQEVETLRSSVTQARTVLENAIEELNSTRILAPFAGVVERTYADAFQRVASGETVVRLVNPVSSTVSFTAPENILSVLSLPTTHFLVEFDAYPSVRFTARIKNYARTSSDALGFPVSLRLVDVDSVRYRISPGMTCVATVITPEPDSRAVVVPIAAICAPATGGSYVWVVSNEERVERRDVTLGSLVGSDGVELLSGVEAGDRVVTAGVYQLSEGERVRIVK